MVPFHKIKAILIWMLFPDAPGRPLPGFVCLFYIWEKHNLLAWILDLLHRLSTMVSVGNRDFSQYLTECLFFLSACQVISLLPASYCQQLDLMVSLAPQVLHLKGKIHHKTELISFQWFCAIQSVSFNKILLSGKTRIHTMKQIICHQETFIATALFTV